jgi:hypothetical protein
MSGSSSSTFLWTTKRMDAALNASLEATRGGKQDPFLERNIIKAVTKLNATILFNCSPSEQVLTAEALRILLYQLRERYQRICQIADLPYGSFSRRYHKIFMSPDDYENHIKVCRALEIIKAPFVVNLEFSIFIPHLLSFHSRRIRQMQSLSTKISTTSWAFICCSVAESTLVREKDVDQQRAPFLENNQRVMLGHREIVHHQDIPLMRPHYGMMIMILCQVPLPVHRCRRSIQMMRCNWIHVIPCPSLQYVCHRSTHHPRQAFITGQTNSCRLITMCLYCLLLCGSCFVVISSNYCYVISMPNIESVNGANVT